MQNTIIPPNQTKRLAYRHQMGRYKMALRQEFYLEAVFILYAMLEDRLRSFLYYCGLTNDARTHPSNNPYSLAVLNSDPEFKIKPKTKIDKISTKRMIAQHLLNASIAGGINDAFIPTTFSVDLFSKIKNISNKAELNKALNDLEPWAAERNALVHDLLGQDPGDFQDRLKVCAEQGYEIARVIDNAVKALHNKPDLREKDSIP